MVMGSIFDEAYAVGDRVGVVAADRSGIASGSAKKPRRHLPTSSARPMRR
jgi:hypothetical protein